MFSQWLTRRRAAHSYYKADRASGKLLWESLPETHLPRERADVLADMALLSQGMAADLAVCDTDNICDDGFTSEQWSLTEAAILRLIAAAEWASDGYALEVDEPQARELLLYGPTQQIIERFVADTTFIGRAEQLVELLYALQPKVGGQAAEILAALAASYRLLGGETMLEARLAVWGR